MPRERASRAAQRVRDSATALRRAAWRAAHAARAALAREIPARVARGDADRAALRAADMARAGGCRAAQLRADPLAPSAYGARSASKRRNRLRCPDMAQRAPRSLKRRIDTTGTSPPRLPSKALPAELGLNIAQRGPRSLGGALGASTARGSKCDAPRAVPRASRSARRFGCETLRRPTARSKGSESILAMLALILLFCGCSGPCGAVWRDRSAPDVVSRAKIPRCGTGPRCGTFHDAERARDAERLRAQLLQDQLPHAYAGGGRINNQ